MDRLRVVKDEAARAMGRSQWREASKLYRELVDIEPKEGTWPLRAGDAARKQGDHKGAIHWYERAATTYARRGFMVRAIAVGKMIESLDPGNDRVLRTLDAEQKELRPFKLEGVEKQKPAKATKAVLKVAPPPIPVITEAKEATVMGPPLGELSGPPLRPSSTGYDLSMGSVEIVFDDVDDGLPIEPSDILSIDDLIEVSEELSEEALLERLPSFPLFQVLPKGAFLSVASQMKHMNLEPGEVVVRQGELGTTLYAIIEGEASVYAEGPPEQTLANLGPGEIFGEIALILDQPRAATVKATTELELFEMDRELFRTVVDEHPQLSNILSRMIKRRLVENVMGTAPLFQLLDHDMRKELMLKFEVRDVPAATKLVEQGTATDGLYVVLYGKIQAYIDDHQAAALTRGQIFGISSLIDASHQSPASFKASQQSLVLRLPRSAFHEVISCYPPVLEHLAEVAESQQEWSEDDSLQVV